MSLINDALKKAQKQRTGEAPKLSSLPSIGGERPVHIAKRKTPPGFNSLLLGIGLGAGVLVIVVVGGLLLFRGKGTDTPPAAPAVAVTNPTVSTASTPAPAPATPAPAAPSTPNSAFVVPNVASTAPTTTAPTTPASAVPSPPAHPAAPETRPLVAQAPAPVVEQPKAEIAKTPAPALKLEPRAMNYIEGLRVAGIRASATDSKVLMNDRVYRVGDVVEHEMGLKLVGITSSSLTFEDERGGRYTRNF
jgi:hypothetical protein